MALQKLFESSYWTDINKNAVSAVLEDRKRFLRMSEKISQVATFYDGIEINKIKTSKTDTYTKAFVSPNPERLAAILAVSINESNGISHSVQFSENEYKVSWMERYMCSVFLSRDSITDFDRVLIYSDELSHAMYSLQAEYISLREEFVEILEQQLKKINKFYKSNTHEVSKNVSSHDIPSEIMSELKDKCILVESDIPIFIADTTTPEQFMGKHPYRIKPIRSVHDYRMVGNQITLTDINVEMYFFNFSMYDPIPYYHKNAIRYANKWVSLRVMCLLYKFVPKIQEKIKFFLNTTDEIVDYHGKFIDKTCSLYPVKQKINTVVYIPEKNRREKGYYILPGETEKFQLSSSSSSSDFSTSESDSSSESVSSSSFVNASSTKGGYLSLSEDVATGSSTGGLATHSFFASA